MQMSPWSLVWECLRLTWMALKDIRSCKLRTYVYQSGHLPALQVKACIISLGALRRTELVSFLKLMLEDAELLSPPPPSTPADASITGSSPQTPSQSPQKPSGDYFYSLHDELVAQYWKGRDRGLQRP
jgi:hypothetical protein